MYLELSEEARIIYLKLDCSQATTQVARSIQKPWEKSPSPPWTVSAKRNVFPMSSLQRLYPIEIKETLSNADESINNAREVTYLYSRPKSFQKNWIFSDHLISHSQKFSMLE